MTERLTRILHADDESDIRAVSHLALETIGGFTVALCSSGAEALDRAPSFLPQLFLLDVVMPGMSGPDTLQALRKLPQFAATPAIFLTSNVQPDEMAHYRNIGALEVIPKPLDPLTLSARILEIWDKHHA